MSILLTFLCIVAHPGRRLWLRVQLYTILTGLAYAVGVLEADGFEVKFIDSPAMAIDKNELYRIAADFKPDLTVVDTTTASIYSDVEVGAAIHTLTQSSIGLVGTHASATPDETLAMNTNILAVARGCPHQCAFCVYPQVMTGHRYRYRSVKNLVDEMEYITREFPMVKEIFIVDDMLTVHKERCLEIGSEIKRRKLKVTWSANSRADIDAETLNAIGSAGCRLLCVGFTTQFNS